jgi:hypothetical protein
MIVGDEGPPTVVSLDWSGSSREPGGRARERIDHYGRGRQALFDCSKTTASPAALTGCASVTSSVGYSSLGSKPPGSRQNCCKGSA